MTVRSAIYKARYNCAPSQALAVITNEEPETLNFFRWGLIPSWADDPSIGYRMINAKAETICEKPSYRNAFRNRRCLVPADSFFEWKKNHDRIPYRILLKDQSPFSMAGIWDKWKDPDGNIIHSFSIITTSPNPLMEKIHARMPVILKRGDERLWLGNTGPDELLGLLKPYPAEAMTSYPISRLVNDPKNDTEEILKPS